ISFTLLGIVVIAGCSRPESENGPSANVAAARPAPLSPNASLARAKANLPPVVEVENSESKEQLALESKSQALLKEKNHDGAEAATRKRSPTRDGSSSATGWPRRGNCCSTRAN